MSSHTLEKLVYMANQIAREFDRQQPKHAVDATWDHLWHFWDPRMRGMIITHLRAGGEGLIDTARAAVTKLAMPKEPEPQTRATEFNQADDNIADRDLMSDAG